MSLTGRFQLILGKKFYVLYIEAVQLYEQDVNLTS